MPGMMKGIGHSGYLLNDQFTTNRAAGAVNGTATEPGSPWGVINRAVVDTAGTKLSLSGGQAVFLGGATNNPCLYDATGRTRVAGLTLVSSFSKAVAAPTAFPMGWYNATPPGTNLENVFRTSGAQLQAREGATTIVCGVFATGTTYNLAITLRAAGGAFYFVKGGAYTNWSLVWVSTTNNTATVYADLGTADANINADYFKVPVVLWLPSPLVSDGFGSTFGTTDGLGHAEGVTGGLGAGGGSLVWTDAGTWATNAGLVANTPVFGTEVVVNGNMELNSDWNNWSAPSTSAQSNEQAHGGTYSWKVINTGGTGQGISQAISTTAGIWYSYSTWLYVTTYTNDLGIFMRKGDNSDWVLIPVAGGNLAANTLNAWQKVMGTARQVSSGSPALGISVGCQFSGNAAFYADDATVTPLPISSLITDQQLSTTDVYVEELIHARTPGTQVGMVLNADRSFAAKAAATAASGQAVISLKEVTGVGGVGLSTNDTITVGGTTYTVASVTGGSNVAYNDTAKTQTVTLGTNLGAQVAVDAKVGLDWASWNGVLLYFDGSGNVKLDEVKAGVYTNRGSTAVTFVADKKLICRKTGTEYRWFFNNALITSSTAVDAAAMAGKYHGLFSTYSGNTIDSCLIYATGSDGQYDLLDRYSS